MLTFEPQFGMVCASLPHLERAYGYGLRRMELVVLPAEETEAIWRFVEQHDLEVGLHAPVYRVPDFPFRALNAAMVDVNAERRALSLGLWEESFRVAAEHGARYVLVHIGWAAELVQEPLPAGFGEAQGLALAVEMGEKVLGLSEHYGVPVLVENSIANPAFCRAESYVALLERLPELRLCLDTGHAFIDARKYGFDPVEFARAVAPHVGEFHLYGNTLLDEFDFPELLEKQAMRKHPPHPSHDVEAGWMDNAALLQAVLSVNPEARVTFEVHFTMDVDRERTLEGLLWTREVCLRARTGG